MAERAKSTVNEVIRLVKIAGRAHSGASVQELGKRNLAKGIARDAARARGNQNPDDYANNLGNKQN